jgi:hypothetical protein
MGKRDGWNENEASRDERKAPTPEPMAYHRCPVCKMPMKRVETENHGGGWVFDCKCLDADTEGKQK